MNNFRKQQTKLIFHFIHLFQGNPSYKEIYLTSQQKFFPINGKELVINYTDNENSYKYYIAEKIYLIGDNYKSEKTFLIEVNKYIDNHYNVITDRILDKKTFSLEIIVYSKIKKCLEEIDVLINIKI